jgi:hypothetical protein
MGREHLYAMKEGAMKTIEIPAYGLTITISDDGAGNISSELHDADESEAHEGAMHAIESLVLAHACAGVDVSSPAYLEGLDTAVQAIENNL